MVVGVAPFVAVLLLPTLRVGNQVFRSVVSSSSEAPSAAPSKRLDDASSFIVLVAVVSLPGANAALGESEYDGDRNCCCCGMDRSMEGEPKDADGVELAKPPPKLL